MSISPRSSATKGFADTSETTPLRATRRMSVIAQDPSVKRADGRILMSEIEVPAEDLDPGPIGYRVQVVDYDSSTGRYHGRHILPEEGQEPRQWQEGNLSIVGNFRFHAQNAYALVMKTLARFEFALGRRVGWSFKVHQLKIAPNGMLDANAFYSREVEGLVFGYFPGDSGKQVYTCLSHDIVVHETTHALLDALRERYMDPSGPDQGAFHEGFSDVIALLSVFSQVELVTELLRRGPGGREYLSDEHISAEALRKTALFGLAEEMGREMDAVRGNALRRSAEMTPEKMAGWRRNSEFDEVHRRGEVLVAAVMNGFLEIWTRRLQATKGPGQKKHQIQRVAEEGSDIANALVTMWIRALDYMPPVHMEFGDALSAAITADLEVRPDDSRFQLRANMRRSFAEYDIRPAATRADELGAWPYEGSKLNYARVRFESMRTDKDEVFRFIWENRKKLKLRPGAYAEVLSVRPCTRVGKDGFTLHETVAEYYQVARLTEGELRGKGIEIPADYAKELARSRAERIARRGKSLGDVDSAEGSEDPDTEPVTPVYGGGVLIFDEYGKLKYHIHNDVFGSRQTDRLQHLWAAGRLRAGADGARFAQTRLADLHRKRAFGSRHPAEEGW